MEVKAQLNNLRIAPRKVRSLAALLKGMNAVSARQQLEHLVKRPAAPLAKLINSAMANAFKNFGLVKENLYVKQVIVNEGRKLKRFRPKGFGTVSPIEKKTSHIKIILDERMPGMKAEIKPAEEKPEIIERPAEERAAVEKKPTFAKVLEKGKGKRGVFSVIKGLGRKFFRRKTI